MSDNSKGFSYLATPYSVVNPISKIQAGLLRRKRFERACKMAAKLMKEGENIFCPIAHSHSVEYYGMNKEVNSMNFWLKQDLSILQYAKELIVFKMDGWEQSEGIKREIKFAEELNIPIRYIENCIFPNPYVRRNPDKWGNPPPSRVQF
jgi:hypothetical protein